MVKYRDLDGISRYVERSGRTKTEAESRLQNALTERRHIDPGMAEITAEATLAELAEVYWIEFTGKDRSPTTLQEYRRVLHKHILPTIGRLRVRELTTSRADRFIRLLKDNHGASNAKTARTVLSGMFRIAARNDAVAANPVRETTSVAAKPKPAVALTFDQAQDLYTKIHADTKAVRWDLPDLVDMFLVTGMRIGEVLAVTWNCLIPAEPAACDCVAEECPDPDLHERWAVQIRGTVVRIERVGLVIKPEPKSEAGFRTLVLPAWYTRRLEERQAASAFALPTDPVFPRLRAQRDPDDPAGVATLLRDKSNTTKHLRKAFDKAGYPEVTSHIAGRKTLATEMKRSGKNDLDTADQLGHADIAVTQKHYFGRETVVAHGADIMEKLASDKDDKKPAA